MEAGVGGLVAVTFVDGRRVAPGEAAVRADDRGILLGDGLFETLRAYGGVPFRLGAHLARLEDGARRVGLPLPPELREQVEAAIEAFRREAAEAIAAGATAAGGATTGGAASRAGAEAGDAGSGGQGTGAGARIPDASIRITVSRGPGPLGLAPPGRPTPTVIVTVREYRDDPGTYRRGVRAILATGRRNDLSAIAGIKQTGYLEAVVALEEAKARGADDAIFLDTRGHLAEATTSNLFLVTGRELRTPPLACGILGGVTRSAVMEVAAAAGYAVREEELFPEALHGADEAFLTASNREIVPLVEVDGQRIGSGEPGPVTRELHERYRALVRRETGR